MGIIIIQGKNRFSPNPFHSCKGAVAHGHLPEGAVLKAQDYQKSRPDHPSMGHCENPRKTVFFDFFKSLFYTNLESIQRLPSRRRKSSGIFSPLGVERAVRALDLLHRKPFPKAEIPFLKLLQRFAKRMIP